MVRHYRKRIRVHRRAYRRNAFTRRRRGHVIHVKATFIPATNFYERDRGRSGKGPKLFKLKKGGLYGWHHSQGSEIRHEHLRTAAQRSSWLTVFHRLDALAKISKRTQPSVSERAREDANWVRREYID